MSMKQRVINLLLVFSISISLTACGSNNGENIETSEDVTSENEQSSPYDENGYLKDSLPNNLDFGGRTVNIYVRGDNISTEFDAEATGDIVDDSIFERNSSVETRLNVDLNYFSNTGTDIWGDRLIYVDTVRTAVMADDGSVDIVGALSYMAPYMAQEGLFFNLLDKDMPYLDLDKPWWSSSLSDELAVGNKLYYVSGDASLGMIKGMFCFYFNKDILESYQMEDPYQLVSDGKWTLDKAEEMSAVAYDDINGNTQVDFDSDRFGLFVLSVDFIPNFLVSSGLKMTSRDENGLPAMELGSAQITDFIERMSKLMSDTSVGVSASNNENQYIFHENRALFLAAQLSTSETMRDLKFNFGVVPYPKYNEEQSEYLTTSRSTYSAFSIPITADKNISAAVLEAMASESYRSTTPAYFESALKVKYSRDNVSSQMFDLIRQGICFEFGIFHGIMLDSITTDIRNVICGYTNSNWASTWASRETKINTLLEEFIEDIQNLEE